MEIESDKPEHNPGQKRTEVHVLSDINDHSRFEKIKLKGGEPVEIIEDYERAFMDYFDRLPPNSSFQLALKQKFIQKDSRAWTIVEAMATTTPKIFFHRLKALAQPQSKIYTSHLTDAIVELSKPDDPLVHLNTLTKALDRFVFQRLSLAKLERLDYFLSALG